MRTSESQVNTDTALAEIAWLSSNNPQQVFHSLMHHFNMDSLRRCFEKLDGKRALGVDGIRACCPLKCQQALTEWH